MIAVIFQFDIHKGHKDDYFDLAADLRPFLQEVDGFISIERFQSVHDPNRLLSLSFWRDEGALSAWRNLEDHRRAQTKGRASILQDYRLSVAEVVRDYGMHDRAEAPKDSKSRHG